MKLKQHVGPPCEPIVQVGEQVKKGQLIATCEWTNLHASVYGTVTEVSSEGITVRPDAEQPEEYVKIKETDSYLEAIQEAGVVGAGGAGFPTFKKYATKLNGGCVIMNAAECEPVLRHNMHLIKQEPELLIRGLKYAMELAGAAKGYVAIKAKNTQELIAIAKACKHEADIEVKYLPDLYPSGDERAIVREIIGVILRPGQLPLEANAVISNVETLKRIAEAIELRKPVITKDFTIGGRLQDTQGECSVYLDEPIGMPIKKYIDECGGYVEPHGEILIGGPFTGSSGREDAVITKVTSGILVAMPYPSDHRKFGILACECGAGEARLTEIVEGMGGTVVAEAKCKRMVEVGGRFRCDEPGVCPGQTERVLELRAQGAEVIVAGACED